MAEEKKIGTPVDESNVDQINSLITSSGDDTAEASVKDAEDKEEDYAVVGQTKSKDKDNIDTETVSTATVKKVIKPKQKEHIPISHEERKQASHEEHKSAHPIQHPKNREQHVKKPDITKITNSFPSLFEIIPIIFIGRNR